MQTKNANDLFKVNERIAYLDNELKIMYKTKEMLLEDISKDYLNDMKEKYTFNECRKIVNVIQEHFNMLDNEGVKKQ